MVRLSAILQQHRTRWFSIALANLPDANNDVLSITADAAKNDKPLSCSVLISLSPSPSLFF